ncbi:MAG: hypothetical protein L0Z62_20280 [Gemmataceae bacterium]|nr:hypothetical protein [Gemmataceae bacterium]
MKNFGQWWLYQKLILALCVAGVATAAFFWGRHGAAPQAAAQMPPPRSHTPPAPLLPAGGGDYGQRVVAILRGNIPITREELGEYLIARFGPERLEFLVNRRIIEMACQERNIQVSDAEVDAKLQAELKAWGTTEKDFREKILKRLNKNMYEYREDKLRPEIAMTKLCEGLVTVTEDDIKKAFEAKFGEQVECRMLVLSKELQERQIRDIWQKVRASESEFDDQARKQFIPELAMKAGQVPPIHKHSGVPAIEKEAFSLRNPGDVSSRLQMPDGSWVILKLVRHIPAQTTKNLGEERMKLHEEVSRVKLAQMIPEKFQEMRRQANPNLLLRRENQLSRHEQERQIQEELKGVPGMPALGPPPSPLPKK